MSNFKVGQKVVCITFFEYDNEDIRFGVKHPVKDQIYTIRDVETDLEGIFIKVDEIINPKLQYLDGYGEQRYNMNHFRPLDHQFAEDVIAYIKELELVNQ